MRHSLRNSGQDPRYAAFRAKGGTLSYETWAQVMKIAIPVAAAAAPASARVPEKKSEDKTYADLMKELEYIGPGVIVALMMVGQMKQCDQISRVVVGYLVEKGFIARQTEITYGHYTVIVYTEDKGFVEIDPTYGQFEQLPTMSGAAALSKKYGESKEYFFEPTVEWAVKALQDATVAFKITKAKAYDTAYNKEQIKARTPPNPKNHYANSFEQYFSIRRKLIEDALNGVSDEDDLEIYHLKDDYWFDETVRRMKGKKISGI